ncbi:MAG: hypothetical protein ACLGIO_14260 [Acidimicrobiia bacterium]
MSSTACGAGWPSPRSGGEPCDSRPRLRLLSGDEDLASGPEHEPEPPALCPRCAARDQDPDDDVYGWCRPCIDEESPSPEVVRLDEVRAQRRREQRAERNRRYRARRRAA